MKTLIKEEQQLIKRGYSRVAEKIKKIRQKFSSTIISGKRSASGKVVMEHYDELVGMYGGSPSTEPLEYGCRTGKAATVVPEQIFEDDDDKFSSANSGNII